MTKANARSGPVPVQSVGRSLDLLEAVAAEELGLVELAERARLQPSTAYRLLATLTARGYVTRSPASGRFRLGHKVLGLAVAAERGTERLRSTVRPHLQQLQEDTDETANLLVPDGLAVVYVDQVESSRAVRMFTTIGRRVSLHACAGGKAILAFASGEALDQLLTKGLDRLTARTLVTPEVLLADLELTRERGYAVDQEEYEEGVVCIAAAIIGGAGEAIAALSVSGPAARMLGGDVHSVGELVRGHARQGSEELGALPQLVG